MIYLLFFYLQFKYNRTFNIFYPHKILYLNIFHLQFLSTFGHFLHSFVSTLSSYLPTVVFYLGSFYVRSFSTSSNSMFSHFPPADILCSVILHLVILLFGHSFLVSSLSSSDMKERRAVFDSI
jgi:hypothetical protein